MALVVNATVTAYEKATGLGCVTNEAGENFAFHATAITDGSRDIAVGTLVSVELAPTHAGVTEARRVLPHRG